MKLYDAVQEAKQAGYAYVAIDKDGEMYGYKIKPIHLLNHNSWGFRGDNYRADVCMFLGKFEYVVVDYTKNILNVNDLTLRGC